LTDVLVGVYAIAERHDLIVTNVFHAGDGNLHPLFSFDLSVPGTLERVLAAADEVVRLCVDAGGALSGEHGIGLEKRDSCRWSSPPRISTRRRVCARRSTPTTG
jgi:glycolate oxidase